MGAAPSGGLQLPAPRVYTLQIRTDNNPVIDWVATSDWKDNQLRYSAQNLNILDVVKSIAAAKTRVVVRAAPNVSGGRTHLVTFSAKGAGEAINKTFKACNIDATPSG
jgi:hypothetical protein